MALSKEELRKLSPEQRIKRLKEMEEERKKEAEESRKMIEESVDEIQREETTKKVKLPEERKVDIDRMFQSELEETVQREKPKEVEEDKNIQYMINQYDGLKEMQSIYGNNLTDEQRQRLGEMYAEINKREEAAAKYSSAADEAKDIATGAKRIIKELLGYDRNKDDERFYHTH